MNPKMKTKMLSLVGVLLAATLVWWLDGNTSVSSSPEGDVEYDWFVVQVFDGDTIEVRRDGVTERVRIIGIDTPERDRCGYSEASARTRSWVAGEYVSLIAGATTDRDSYDRLLRYVEIEGVDVGFTLVDEGLARAWYDSRSGKPHPREEDYRAADRQSVDLCSWS